VTERGGGIQSINQAGLPTTSGPTTVIFSFDILLLFRHGDYSGCGPIAGVLFCPYCKTLGRLDLALPVLTALTGDDVKIARYQTSGLIHLFGGLVIRFLGAGNCLSGIVEPYGMSPNYNC